VRLRGERPLPAQTVDRAVARSRDQPGAGIVGEAVAGPPLGGNRERLLGGLLSEIEVAEEADQGGQDARPLVVEDLLDQRYISTSGRTSTEPPRRAAGIRPATSSALSMSAAS
jgi:hypothetical protein